MSREVIIAHLSPLRPASHVRSTLLQSSLNFVRERGHFDAYLRLVDPAHRETIIGSLAPGWLPIEVGVAHYRACDALPLSADERIAIGESVGDRAILETFYSTGMRRSELVNLAVFDLDTERGTILIRQGKGKKDRMVPVGERAAAWIEKYVYEARPGLVVGPDEGALFLTNTGEAFTPNRLSQLVRNYVKAAELGKTGSCHIFRHTAATLML